MVYNVALGYVQNKEEAEEITQDVFVSVYQKLDQFDAQAKHSTWIYRITINKSLDYIKSKRRKKRFGFMQSLFSEKDGSVQFEPVNFNHPGVELEDKEALEHLFSIINELPDKQKTALILHKLELKSQAEIAEIMNTTNKAIESLIQRAKKNLEKKLNDSEG